MKKPTIESEDNVEKIADHTYKIGFAYSRYKIVKYLHNVKSAPDGAKTNGIWFNQNSRHTYQFWSAGNYRFVEQGENKEWYQITKEFHIWKNQERTDYISDKEYIPEEKGYV